jgi:alginate O-acetyltransferase complex protein AlgI
MPFNSFPFLVFIGLFFALWPLARKNQERRWAFLVLFSFFFYGWWDWRYLPLLILVGSFTFWTASQMLHHRRSRRRYLILALFANISPLLFFKYSKVLWLHVAAVSSLFGITISTPTAAPHFFAALPVGLSFYTFQALTYSIEMYRGTMRPAQSLLHFFAYLAMFPQILSGPIARAREMLPQLAEYRPNDEAQRWSGFTLVVFGYFKKVVIADNLASFVEKAFSSPSLSGSSPYCWAAVTAFALQIYFDFAGYTDIARGLARLMGYELPINFNRPYISRSLRDFWLRWHISLMTWFRDYVFLPIAYGLLRIWKQERIAGMRTETLASCIGALVTWLLCGLWHGSASSFIFWGGLNGILICIEHLTRWPKRLGKIAALGWLLWPLTLVQVWVGWVFFRATTLSQAFAIIRTLFSFSGQGTLGLSSNEYFFFSLAAASGLTPLIGRTAAKTLPSPAYRWATIVAVALLLTACIYLRGPAKAFVYFQF